MKKSIFNYSFIDIMCIIGFFTCILIFTISLYTTLRINNLILPLIYSPSEIKKINFIILQIFMIILLKSMFWIKINYEGGEIDLEKQNYIIIGNHISYFDICAAGYIFANHVKNLHK